MKARGGSSVMQQRREPPASLDFFPTPPWATRALLKHAMPPLDAWKIKKMAAWDPACGEGHMAEPLREHFLTVSASDVFDYGYGAVIDFLDLGTTCPGCDWIITNPPFKTASAFAMRAFEFARCGVALLVRTSWLEGAQRFRHIFSACPPTVIGQFVERVPMVKGHYDPSATTATSYCWVVWVGRPEPGSATAFVWIPPCRAELTKLSDARFVRRKDAPLFSTQETING